MGKYFGEFSESRFYVPIRNTAMTGMRPDGPLPGFHQGNAKNKKSPVVASRPPYWVALGKHRGHCVTATIRGGHHWGLFLRCGLFYRGFPWVHLVVFNVGHKKSPFHQGWNGRGHCGHCVTAIMARGFRRRRVRRVVGPGFRRGSVRRFSGRRNGWPSRPAPDR